MAKFINKQVHSQDEQRLADRTYKIKVTYIDGTPKRKLIKTPIHTTRYRQIPPTPIRNQYHQNQIQHLNQNQTPTLPRN